MTAKMMKYTIFGPGRVGSNITAYLAHLGHQTTLISRVDAETDRANAETLVTNADVIIAALPDDRLLSWFESWSNKIGDRPAIHFSGAINIDGMLSFHPLYSFSKTPIELTQMAQIAFACPDTGPQFADIFPGAKNPTFKISDSSKAHYHALAVLSGNFAAYLWNQTAIEFSKHHDVSAEKILGAYFQSIVERFKENPENSLTGPIARRDRESVKKNMAAIEQNPKLLALYQSFLSSAWPDFDNDVSNKPD